MQSKPATYTVFIRTIWLMLALCTVVFCGPVKKLIENRLDASAVTAQQSADKKLKTWHREKRESSPAIHFATQVAGGDLTIFFISALLSISFIFRKNMSGYTAATADLMLSDMPLYLQCGRLQV